MHVATGGVFYYDYNLAKALLRVDPRNRYTFLDYLPIHGGWRNPIEVASLVAPNADTVRVRGVRHYRVSRWKPAQGRVTSVLARSVDTLLERPLSAMAQASMRSGLSRALAGVDVFHGSDVLLWAQPGAVNVVTIHDLTTVLFPELHTEENRALHGQRLRFAKQHANLILVGSESTRSDVERLLGIPGERIRVVPYGVDAAFRPVTDRERLAKDLEAFGLVPGNYVLHVGTLEPRKNLVCLVKAFAQLLRMQPKTGLKLALVGAMGWQFRDVLTTIRDLRLEDAVVVTGPVTESLLPSVYSGAVVFAYPSLYEGFGLPPLEAMACGTPVVASRASSIPEVVGDAGLYVDPGDVDGLTGALASLVADPNERLRLQQLGLARASQFSWEHTAQRTLEAYGEMVDGHRRPS
ncbi:MAG: glycosyltransferase family 4 protein [Anaerolineae bacterium]|nr:glycosyltransferase family 4 protein [Anaerolineae bacterium]